MMLHYFGLREQPFGVTPDPRFLFASPTHREALSSLLYGIESGLGFVVLTAQAGMGKTTLLREVLRRMSEKTETVFLFQTIVTPADLIRSLLIDLGVVDLPDDMVDMQTRLNEILLSYANAGKCLLLVIDEAQNLSESVLEAIRMLSNFETTRQKVIQIVLCGQPRLADKLALPQLLQLRQRVSIFGNLKPLSACEVVAYIGHRLQVAGYDLSHPLYTDSALAQIAQFSEGIPRNINNICFNSLSLGRALQLRKINSDVVREVVSDLGLDCGLDRGTAPEKVSPSREKRNVNRQQGWQAILLGAAGCGVAMLLLWLAFLHYNSSPASASVETSSIGTATPPAGAAESAKIATQAPNRTSDSATVQKGESVQEICSEHFEVCTRHILQEIVKMNPSIVDLDHIEPGQRISLPFLLSPNSIQSNRPQARE